MNLHTHQKSAIQVCCLNVNHSNAATHTVMHYITTCKDPAFDIILIQEPWWQEINLTYTSVSLSGWQLTLPILNLWLDKHPRTAAYHKIGTGINLTLRTDITQDADFMILNISRERASWAPITLINIYNQKPLNNNPDMLHEWTANRLQNYIPHHSIPMIITGDWNMRDPSWDNGMPGLTPCTWETLEWLHGLSFNLKNEPNVPTREDSCGHASTIDLVFTNETTSNTGILSKLHIYHWAPSRRNPKPTKQQPQLEACRWRNILQSDQWGDRTEPRHTHKNGERATQPEQKFCLRIQTRRGSKDDPRVPRMSSNQSDPCQMNSQQIKTMVDQWPFQSLWRSEEHKGSTQKLDEGIPLSLTLPSRTSHP